MHIVIKSLFGIEEMENREISNKILGKLHWHPFLLGKLDSLHSSLGK